MGLGALYFCFTRTLPNMKVWCRVLSQHRTKVSRLQMAGQSGNTGLARPCWEPSRGSFLFLPPTVIYTVVGYTAS